MQTVLAGSLLFTKFFMLGCFSLMGVGEALANKPVPCHEVDQEMVSDCPVCPMAFDVWDSEATLEIPEVLVEIVDFSAAIFSRVDVFSLPGSFVVTEIRPPPEPIPDISLFAFNTVRLIL